MNENHPQLVNLTPFHLTKEGQKKEKSDSCSPHG